MSLKNGKKQFKKEKKHFIFGVFLMLGFLLLGNIKTAGAVDGIMNGKTVTGESDNYIFWLQTYDKETSPYFFDKFFVGKNGNVGIGKTNPNYMLDINGAINATSVLVNGVAVGSGGSQWVSAASGTIYYTGGNVGVGITNPTAKLDDSGSFKNSLTVTHSAFGNAGDVLIMSDNDGVLYTTSTEAFLGGSSGVNFWGGVKNANIWNGDEGAGNVGIGTTAPAAKLHILSAASSTPIMLSFSNGNVANNYTGIVFSGETPKAGILFASNGAGYARGNLIFATSNSMDYSGINLTNERMRITDTGNVGIGTTNPDQLLTLTKTGTVGVNFYSYSADVNDYPYFSFRKSHSSTLETKIATVDGERLGSFGFAGVNSSNTVASGASISAIQSGAAGAYVPTNLVFRTYSSNALNDNVLVAASTGNVGIGTTNPLAKLEVKGANAFFTDATGVGVITLVPSPTLNQIYSNYYSGSDIPMVLGTFANRTNQLYLATSGNVGISTTTPAARLHVYGNGTTAAAFTNGNVGINKSNPTANLDVSGTGAFSGNISASGGTFGILSGGGTRLVLTDNSGNIYATSTSVATGIPSANGNSGYTLRSDGSNWVANSALFNDGTNVGIGTAAPTAPLQVSNSSTTLVSAIFDNAITSTALNNYNYLKLRVYNSGVVNAQDVGIGGVSDSVTGGSRSTALALFYGNQSTGFSEGMRITGSGLVGIGTTTPSNKVHVTNYNATPLLVEMTNNNNWLFNTVLKLKAESSKSTTDGYGIGIKFTMKDLSAIESDIGHIGAVRSGADNEGALVFQAGTDGAEEFMRITNTGLVGIGTTTPAARLHVYGNGTTAAAFTNGNVGINKSNPTANLDVSGTGAFSGNISASGGTFNVLSGGGTRLVVTDDSGNIYATSTSVATGIPSANGNSGYTLRSDGSNWVANSTLFNDGTNVGIGATTLGEKLTISGNVYISGVGNKLYFDTTGGSKGVYQYIGDDYDFHIYNTRGNSSRFILGNSSISLGTNSTKMLYLNNGNGFVGIGTTAPGAPLTIYKSDGGSIAIQSQKHVTTALAFENQNGTGGAIYENARIESINHPSYLDSGYLKFYTAKTSSGGLTEKMVIEPNGFVGIGTTTPAARLHVYGNGTTAAAFTNGNVGIGKTNPGADFDVLGKGAFSGNLSASGGTFNVLSGGGTRLVVTDDSGNIYATSTSVATGIPSANGNSGYTLRSDGSNWVANSTLFNNGTNVGIGISSPVYKLHVAGTSYLNGQITTSLTGSGSRCLYVDENGNVLAKTTDCGTATGGDNLGDHTATQNIKLNGHWLSGDGGDEGVFVKSDGNVGIGTTTPGAALQIAGSVSGSTLLLTNSGGANGLNFGGTTDPNRAYVSVGSDGATFYVWNSYNGSLILGTNNAERVRLTAGGNVGISTTTPAARLHVYGNGTTAAVFTNGNVGIGRIPSGVMLDVSNAFRANSATISSIGGAGVVMSDASGNLYSTPSSTLLGSYLPLSGGTMSGSIDMGGKDISNVGTLTVNKLSATTIDPLYDINGTKYSTFAASIAGGVKEEYVGKIKIETPRQARDDGAAKEYEATINFAKIETGSDLWVWRQVVDFNKENVDIAITPYGSFAQVYYLINGNKIIFRSDRPIEISYRLIGKRFDWRNWPTKAIDQTEKGFEVKNN